MATINFDKKINESVQVGDELYYLTPPSTTPIKAGPGQIDSVITGIGTDRKHIDVNPLDSSLAAVASGTFFMFLKPEHTNANLPNGGYTNVSSLKGYYAEVKMLNTSTSKQELFVVGSEVTISSK
tara:strand:+ start:67 stop:441 length:375 start_codon:yes stop_codon:yes gene_type:complete